MTRAAISPPPSSDRTRFSRVAGELLLILLAGLFVYCWKLGDSPLDRTEPHRALVAHQMVQSGDWLIPRLFGEVYLRKPPLIYWIEASAEKLIGRGDEFVWRLPSAIASGLLAVALAWWAGRWFGSFARLPAGFACLALIALWEQNRGADIDAINTVASVIAAMIVLEIAITPIARSSIEEQNASLAQEESRGVPRRSKLKTGPGRPGSPFAQIAWSLALALFISATLLLKGPGGFPPILGAIVGPAIALRTWRHLRKPGLWIGLLLGVAGFVSYGIVAKAALRREGLHVDAGGVKEALQRMLLHDPHQIVSAVTAPLRTLFYALPVSLAIPFALQLVWREPKDDPRRVRVTALIATIAAALVTWIIAGNGNPRYEYVALPLLAPLAGVVAVAWRKGQFSPSTVSRLRGILLVFSALFVIVQLVLTRALWATTADRPTLAIAAGISLVIGIVAVFAWIKSRYRPAAPLLVVVVLLLTVPLSDRKNIERRKKSAQSTARQLRDILGPDATLGVAEMVRDMPELFYYADVRVHAFGEFGLDKLAAAPGGQWVVLSEAPYPEYSTLTMQIPNAFPRGVTKLNMPDARDKVYLGWYEPPPGTPRVINYAANAGTTSVGGDE